MLTGAGIAGPSERSALRRDPAGCNRKGMMPEDMMVGWTTTETRADADRLARGMVEDGLAACAQVSGPITSYYRWKGKLAAAEEFRVAVKFAGARATAVEDWIASHHPYEMPQWVAVRAGAAAKNYLKWVVDLPS